MLSIVAGGIYAPAAFLFWAVAAAAMLGGTWLLTRPDPSGTGETWYGQWRRLTRVLPVALWTFPIVEGLRNAAAPGLMPAGVADDLLRMAQYLSGLAGIGWLLAMLAFVRSLAATRVTDWALAEAAGRAFSWLAAGGTLTVVEVVVAAVVPPTRAGGGILRWFDTIASVVLLWGVAQFVRVIWELRGALATQAKLARQLWPAPSKASVPGDLT